MITVKIFSLTPVSKYAYSLGMYSTAQVARLIGVDKQTLLRWMYAGKLSEPRRSEVAGLVVRVWTERDLARARKFKEQNYRKGRGRKPAPKQR